MKAEERQKIFNRLRKEYEEEGYSTREHTISVLTANLMTFVVALPIVIICGIIYFNVHNFLENSTVILQITLGDMVLVFPLVIALCFIHEWLHGVTWRSFCKDKKSISYGMMWKQLTPYCCCAEPLSFKAYILGGLMPFLVLGIGVFLVSLALGNFVVFVISVFNIFSAAGDLTVVLMLMKCRNSIIIDHPTKCGFVTFNK